MNIVRALLILESFYADIGNWINYQRNCIVATIEY